MKPNAWINGSFYIAVFIVVITGLAVTSNSVLPLLFPMVVIAAIILVPIIGALQLRQDDNLSEKSFLQLVQIAINQLPLIRNLPASDDTPDNADQ